MLRRLTLAAWAVAISASAMVRSTNACGTGSWGSDSEGLSRSGACP